MVPKQSSWFIHFTTPADDFGDHAVVMSVMLVTVVVTVVVMVEGVVEVTVVTMVLMLITFECVSSLCCEGRD